MALAWQEMLHIGDRNEGFIKGTIDSLALFLQSIYLSDSKRYNTEWRANKVRMSIEWMSNKGWIQVERNGIRIVNHAKYHRTREPNQFPTEPNLSESLSYKNKNKDSRRRKSTADDPDSLTVKDLVDSWNSSFAGVLPTVQWPLAKSRQQKAALRLREHQSLEFWQRVFNNIGQSSFLLGQNNGSWRCTLDFLIANDSNSVKIYEGGYNR